jgi:hypothetical protein
VTTRKQRNLHIFVDAHDAAGYHLICRKCWLINTVLNVGISIKGILREHCALTASLQRERVVTFLMPQISALNFSGRGIFSTSTQRSEVLLHPPTAAPKLLQSSNHLVTLTLSRDSSQSIRAKAALQNAKGIFRSF